MPSLSGSGQPLFVAGPLDDLVAVAETRAGLESTLLVPERCEALLELVQLSRQHGVVAFRKQVPELGATLGRGVDLGSDLVDISHVCENDVTPIVIP